MSIILPKEIVYNILTYTGKFKIRNGKLMSIISKEDLRYTIFQNIPKPLDFSSNMFLYFKLNITNNNREKKIYKIVIDLRNQKYIMTICVVLHIKNYNHWYSTNTYSLHKYERL